MRVTKGVSGKMNPLVKALWLERLRSGRYPQTQGGLRRIVEDGDRASPRPVGFCCLGVLCDANDSARWTSEPDGEGLVRFRYIPGDVFAEPGNRAGPDATMTHDVEEWAGLDGLIVSFTCDEDDEEEPEKEEIEDFLIAMNDDQEMDFEAIADWVEKWL